MLEYASFTAIGSREENQDRFLVLTNEADGIYWFAVADGMGGHRCGGQAPRRHLRSAGGFDEGNDTDSDDSEEEALCGCGAARWACWVAPSFNSV